MYVRLALTLSGLTLFLAALSSPSAAAAGPPTRIGSFLDACAPASLLEAAGLLPGQLPPPAPGAESKVRRAVGGGVDLGLAIGETDWSASVGFGVAGFGIYTRDLMPDKSYPFPAVFTVDAELLYFSAESDISDLFFTAHACFGVDLLYRMDQITLYPYTGVGLGFESVSGSKTVAGIRVNASDTNLVLPWELGMGFVYKLNPSMAVFARFGFSFPLNPANVSAFLRMQGGLLFEI